MSLPKPYYDDGKGIVIYNADCRDILPYLPKVDLVLTDPPYGMNFQSNHRKIKYERIANDNNLPLPIINDLVLLADKAAYFFADGTIFQK